MASCRQVVSAVWEQLDNRPVTARQICPSGLVQRRLARFERGDVPVLEAYPGTNSCPLASPRVASPRMPSPRTAASPQAAQAYSPRGVQQVPFEDVRVAKAARGVVMEHYSSMSVPYIAAQHHPQQPPAASALQRESPRAPAWAAQGIGGAGFASRSGSSTPAPAAPPRVTPGGVADGAASARRQGGLQSNQGSFKTGGGGSNHGSFKTGGLDARCRVAPPGTHSAPCVSPRTTPSGTAPPRPTMPQRGGSKGSSNGAPNYQGGVTPPYGSGLGGGTQHRQASFGAMASSRSSSQSRPDPPQQESATAPAGFEQPSPTASPRIRLPSREAVRMPSREERLRKGPQQGPQSRPGSSPRGVNGQGGAGNAASKRSDRRSPDPAQKSSTAQTRPLMREKGYPTTPRTMMTSRTPPPPLPPGGPMMQNGARPKGGDFTGRQVSTTPRGPPTNQVSGARQAGMDDAGFPTPASAGRRGRQCEQPQHVAPRQDRPPIPAAQDLMCALTPRLRCPEEQASTTPRGPSKAAGAAGTPAGSVSSLTSRASPPSLRAPCVDLLEDLNVVMPQSARPMEASFSARARSAESATIQAPVFDTAADVRAEGDVAGECNVAAEDRRPPVSHWVFDSKAIRGPVVTHHDVPHVDVPPIPPHSCSAATPSGRDADTPDAELEASSFSAHSETSPMLQPPPGTWGGGVFDDATQPSPIQPNIVMRRLAESITESLTEAIRSLSPCCHHYPSASPWSPRGISPVGSRSPFGPHSQRGDGKLRPFGADEVQDDCAIGDCEEAGSVPTPAQRPFFFQQPATQNSSTGGGFVTPRTNHSSLATPRDLPGARTETPRAPQADTDAFDISGQIDPSFSQDAPPLCAVHSGDVDDVQGVNDASFDRSIAGSPASFKCSPTKSADEAVVAEETSPTGLDSEAQEGAAKQPPALFEGFKMPDLPMPPARRKTPGTASMGTASVGTTCSMTSSNSTSTVTATGGRGLSGRAAAFALGQPKQTVFFPVPPVNGSEPVFHKGHHQGWMRKGRTPPPAKGFTSPRGGVSPRQATAAGRRGGA